jgi:hypothetical protein
VAERTGRGAARAGVASRRQVTSAAGRERRLRST